MDLLLPPLENFRAAQPNLFFRWAVSKKAAQGVFSRTRIAQKAGATLVMSWSRAFHIPIPLPDGRTLRTLRDAGEYIQELPKAIHQRPEWQIAAEMLLEAVEGKGPLMFAEIAMRKAVNAGKPAPEPTPRRRGSKR
jgi:hypothetical protein